MNLEGIVSKRREFGRSLGSDERLAEGQDERAENRGRWELFTAKRS